MNLNSEINTPAKTPQSVKKSKISIYEITVLNWPKHNAGYKLGFTKTLINNSFCTDSKLQRLPLCVAWFYLGLILCCSSEADQTIDVSSSTAQVLLKKGCSTDQALIALEQFQLVSYRELTLLIMKERKEEKERRRLEKIIVDESKLPSKAAATNFDNISNPTELEQIRLTKSAAIAEIETRLLGPNVFNNEPPNFFKKGKNQFIGRILVSYEHNTEDFLKDLETIANESLLEKMPTAGGRSQYITSRIKKKSLEMHNAAR